MSIEPRRRHHQPMVSNEARFVWDIDALREILRNPQPRNLLEASGILRRLLTDSECLLHKVARGRDFTPRFTVAGRAGYSEPELIKKAVVHLRNPSAGRMGDLATRDLSLDDFLRLPIAKMGGPEHFTVKQLITANVGGGVHQGAPRKKDKAQEIHASLHTLKINGYPYPMEMMRWIATATTDALTPLYLRIRS